MFNKTWVPVALALLVTPLHGQHVKNGIDVLMEQEFAPLAGKRVGLITNQTGLTYDGLRTADVLAHSGKVKLAAILTPEHGLTGAHSEGESVASSKDEATGAPVISLYDGHTNRPQPAMLKGLDALVFDIQDAGARYYTYISTMGYTMEVAAQQHLPYYVLDRPNPINGMAVEGPLLEQKYFSMVGYTRLPMRHGMTVGELARLFNGEKHLGVDLHVIEMQGWSRRMWFDETGERWVNPSPNLRNLMQTALYPGTCLLESPKLSVGRGTDMPFAVVGAPWFKGLEAADLLNAQRLPGVRFMARHFRPESGNFKGEDCDGVEVDLIDRNALDSVRVGLALVEVTLKLHPTQFDLKSGMRLLGSDSVAEQLRKQTPLADIEASFAADVTAFRELRTKYLIYR